MTSPSRLERPQVGGCDRSAYGIELDTAYAQPGASQRDEIAADAAAEVDHCLGAGGGEPRRPVRGDALAGRLLQRVVGEVHPRCVIAELRDGLAAQVILRHGGRDESRRVRLAQAGAERQIALLAGVLGDLVEQQLARGGEQLLERRQIHVGILPCASRERVQRSANTLSTLKVESARFRIGALAIESASKGEHDPRDGVPTSVQSSTA